MGAEEVAGRLRLSVATRYESLVGVSNAIGTHRDPQDLFSALIQRVRDLRPVLQHLLQRQRRFSSRFASVSPSTHSITK
jgi:hypothetical protein